MALYQGANLCCLFFNDDPPPSATLGILAFDAAKTICRLVSLYKSLSDAELLRLRRHVIRSESVCRLNSTDECFLLNLACAERLEELHLAAATVSRLAGNLKHGVADCRKLDFGTREMEKKIDTMEKLVVATRNLHIAMESLTEMEASEKKIQRWRTIRANHGLMVKVECFNDRIMFYRKQVQYYKQNSLWNRSFDKVVSLMARIVCVVYARICAVFGSAIMPRSAGNVTNHGRNDVARSVLRPKFKNYCCRVEHRELYQANLCVFEQNNETLKKRAKNGLVRLECIGGEVGNNNRVYRVAPRTTVGGAGLSLRYANVILFTERCMHAAAGIGDDVRVLLYDMLPGRLKVKLRAMLRSERLKWDSLEGGEEGRSAAVERWRDTLKEVMEWLLPVAHDMVRWHAERNLEKQKFETKPTALLLQTLHYSNLEKVEEAIVEVLVGLSCVHWYHKQQ